MLSFVTYMMQGPLTAMPCSCGKVSEVQSDIDAFVSGDGRGEKVDCVAPISNAIYTAYVGGEQASCVSVWYRHSGHALGPLDGLGSLRGLRWGMKRGE